MLLMRKGEEWRKPEWSVREYRDDFGKVVVFGKHGFARTLLLRRVKALVMGAWEESRVAYRSTVAPTNDSTVKAIAVGQAELDCELHFRSIEAVIDNHRAAFECPACLRQGSVNGACEQCGGEGWLTRYEARNMSREDWSTLRAKRLEAMGDQEDRAEVEVMMDAVESRLVG
jgi:hypothetical protein